MIRIQTLRFFCFLECYNKSQGIVLLQIYDRSSSQNSCARTDIILKRGSRLRRKPTEQTDSSVQLKQEDRNSMKLPFSMDKIPPLLPPLPPFHHSDPLGMNQTNSLFHPMPLHAFANGPKASMPFPNPFQPLPHDNPALRHLDPLSLRFMNPSQLFANQSPFAPPNLGRPTPHALDPTTAALLLDPRYRSLISPFPNPSSSSSPSSTLLPPVPSSSSNNPSSTANGTHNHAHIHSHSHTHLHLGNNNDSPSSNTPNGPSLLPPMPPPPLLPFSNSLAGR